MPLALDERRDEEMRQVLRVHLAGQAFGRPFAAPPGIPADRKAALRAAFDATMKDPEFIADATKAGLEVSPITGAEIDRLLVGIYALPPDLIEKAKLVMKN